MAAGYDADLLAVDGDPLQDPAALHRITAVYVRGTRPEPGPTRGEIRSGFGSEPVPRYRFTVAA